MTSGGIGQSDPRFVDVILDWGIMGLAPRVALVSAYLLGGLNKLSNLPAAFAEQAHFGMHPPEFWAWLTIGVEVIGSVLILLRRFTWLGAGMLGVFTMFAAITANPFWLMQGEARFAATNSFFEHLGLVGGFVLLAMVTERDQRKYAGGND